MKKLLCFSVAFLLAYVGLAQPTSVQKAAATRNGQRPPAPGLPSDYCIQGELERKEGLDKIFVGRKEYYIAHAKISRNGGPATLEDLVVGDYVELLLTRLESGKQLPAAKSGIVRVKEVRSAPRPKPISKEQKSEGEAKALKWNQELAEKGDAYGQYRMGMRYLNGDGVPIDPGKAREYLSKAAAQGSESAASELAKLSAPKPAPQTNSLPTTGATRTGR